jgi:alkylation response protein AidB-like acyl-CoA dehydrogenase
LPQLALATAEARLDPARAHIRTTASAVDEELAAGGQPDSDWVRRVSLAATAATESAIDIVSTLYRAAGSSAVFTGSPLERALRDIFTLGAHRMVQHENYMVHGPQLFS